jgi:hypothetical protein
MSYYDKANRGIHTKDCWKPEETPAPIEDFAALREPPDSPLELNDKQAKVYDLLSALSHGPDDFGSWYLGALYALREQRHDHLSQAAHSIREITDKLPTLAGVPMFQSPLSRTKEIVSDLLKIRDDSYEDGWKGIPITDKLASALDSIEELRPIFEATPRTQRMKAALEKRDPYSQGISPVHRRERDKAFKDVGEFFQSVAHHNRTPTTDQFQESLGSFESLLISYLSPVTVDQQKEILAIIGKVPNSDSENRLNDLLRHNGANLIFLLERLNEPLWIPFLVRLELFKNLREGELTEEGGMIYRSDPALTCLSRLAQQAPDHALAILENLPKSENPQIADQVMRCLASIEDKDLVPRCLKLIKKREVSTQRANFLWFEDLLRTWWKLDAHDEIIEVLRFYLSKRIQTTQEKWRQEDWELAELDRNAIEAIAQAKPLQVAKVVFKSLCFWAKIDLQKNANEPSLLGEKEDSYEDPDCDNPPTYWLEDFKSMSIGSRDLEQTLARRLFAIGTQILNSEKLDEIEEFDALLRSSPWHLFTRLRWQLYADYPKQSAERARKDVLARIPRLSRSNTTHGYELAQMLEAHCTAHGEKFLTPKDVEDFCDAVRSGPIDWEGNPITGDSYPKRFHRKQLHPIRSILRDFNLKFFNELSETLPELRLTTFKPFSSGGARMIENVPPKKALEMPTMSDAELWDFLNNWVPNPKCPDPEKWWVEEDVNALGVMFAEFLESTPARFPASAEWWKNLTRPSVLVKPLDRASTRIADATKNGTETSAAPTENDWRNWFGLASWINSQRTVSLVDKEDSEGGVRPEDHDWNWPCMVVVKFLSAALKSKFEMPSDLISKTGLILQKLVQDRDKNLENKDKPWIDDWLTTAINSVRGSAVDGLLQFSLFHKRKSGNPDPEDWIYNLIISCLQKIDESPAVFAIIGSHLRLMLHLFYDQLKSHPEWLFPPDRKECCNTLIVSHVRYDNPMPKILDALPRLPDAAIDCLSEMNELSETKKEARGDFGARLGTHLGFYYWNKSFSNQATADAILDRYFATAKPSQRGNFIRQIARIFSESPDKENLLPLHEMLCKLWDRRFGKIEQELAAKSITPQDVHSELSAFMDWLGIEGLPFDWRHDQILRAIKLLQKAPVAGFTIKTLEKISSQPERLHASLEILNALMSKDSQELRWKYQAEYLKPILLRGINSENAATKKLAEESREILLRQGQSEYLDLGSE